MPNHPVFAMKFAKVYPLYVQKAERKNRTKEEVDQLICWLTGYDRAGLQRQIEQGNDFATFFAQAPAMHANASAITTAVSPSGFDFGKSVLVLLDGEPVVQDIDGIKRVVNSPAFIAGDPAGTPLVGDSTK